MRNDKAGWKVLPGFTLLEMILAMFIGVVIISLAYAAYRNVLTEWSHFYFRQNQLISMSLLKQTLDRDVDRAISIRANDDHNYELVTQEDTIHYSFGDYIVRRSKDQMDSFEVKVQKIFPHYVSSLEERKVIDRIVLDIATPLEMKDIIILKRYTSSEMMDLYQTPP